MLFNDLAGLEVARWASEEGMAQVMRRVVLPYSLTQLSNWLARGGMAAGARAPRACSVGGVLRRVLFADTCASFMLIVMGHRLEAQCCRVTLV